MHEFEMKNDEGKKYVPFQSADFPRAIVHFDGDSFFSSVETVMNYKLRGLPVITGGERGAATSLSYEAKARGAHRGMPLRDIRRLCPDAVVVASDYTSYSIFAERMYAIVRRYTPEVQEYSIDECFADITGLDRQYGKTYEEVALMIKRDLEASLGLTFGVGLAPNKVLAKVASKHRKPAGFTSIPASGISEFLSALPIGNIWGIGRSSSIMFQKLGVMTAGDLATKPERWLAENRIGKGYREIWHELNGRFIKDLSESELDDIGSIIKSRTFSPPSFDREFVLSQLSKNIEAACIKARRHRVRSQMLTVYLKTQSFSYKSLELSLPVATANQNDIIRLVSERFDLMYRPNTPYRATGVSLRGIRTEQGFASDLFGESARADQTREIFKAVDRLNRAYGSETVYLGSSMRAIKASDAEHEREKWNILKRKPFFVGVENRRKTIDLPYLGKAR